ncbi:MAG: S4 domain-containing protein [Acidobacteriota bacterium]
MRLDLFLKTSRLIPRRSLAQEFCDKGLVTVNEAEAKSSKEIKAGDVIEIRRRDRVTRIQVLQLPATKQVSKNSAADLYRLLEEKVLESDPLI